MTSSTANILVLVLTSLILATSTARKKNSDEVCEATWKGCIDDKSAIYKFYDLGLPICVGVIIDEKIQLCPLVKDGGCTQEWFQKLADEKCHPYIDEFWQKFLHLSPDCMRSFYNCLTSSPKFHIHVGHLRNQSYCTAMTLSTKDEDLYGCIVEDYKPSCTHSDYLNLVGVVEGCGINPKYSLISGSWVNSTGSGIHVTSSSLTTAVFSAILTLVTMSVTSFVSRL